MRRAMVSTTKVTMNSTKPSAISAEADSEMYRSALIALGFVLFLVTFVVLTIARLMLRQLAKREGN